MKQIIASLCVVVALMSSCTKSQVSIPTTASLTRTTANGDTVNFATPADILYTTRCTEGITTINLTTTNSQIGTEVNIIVPTTAGALLTFTAPSTIKQVLLTNGAYSIGATYSTRWIIKLKYFSPQYIQAEITNPQQI
jgi:hypothetical protein